MHAEVPAGFSLREILGHKNGSYVISVNGEQVPEEEWETFFVDHDDIVNIIGLPGDSDADIFRFILIIAITVASQGWGASAANAWGGQAAYWSTAFATVGYLAVNALIPPPMLELEAPTEPKRLQSATGSRNNFLPYGIIPNVYGLHLLYPPYASVPITEVIGEDQFLHMLFCVGLGDYEISPSSVKIGETPASEYDGIEIEQTMSPDLPDIFEEQMAVTLEQSAAVEGDSIIRTTAADTEECSIDFQLPAGLLHTTSKGERLIAYMDLRFEFSPTGAGTWTNVLNTDWASTTKGNNVVIDILGVVVSQDYGVLKPSTFTAGCFNIAGNSFDGMRVGVKFPFPSPGQYDVRVTRVRTWRVGEYATPTWTGNPDLHRKFSERLTWSAIRSISSKPAINLPANTATFLRVRVRASERLTGVLESFNIIAHRKLRQWNKATQQFMGASTTRSPAWAYLDMMTGVGNARPVTDEVNEIWLDELADWNTDCVANDLFYDEVIDYQTSVFEAVRRVCSVGYASLSQRDGKWTVIQEQASAVPVQVFTPRNSAGFSSTKRFHLLPHALKVQFVSKEANYIEDEIIVYDDGYTALNATRFETLPLKGVTEPDMAWRIGRRAIASARLRPEIFTWSAYVESIVCQRGDHVLMQHDVPLWGVGSGRIVSIVGDQITLDERITLSAIKSYVMRVRKQDGTITTFNLLQQGGDVSTHTSEIPLPSGINVGDLAFLGEVGVETAELVITGISPDNDLGATFTALDAAPAILTSDTGPIPPYDPGITLPVDPSRIRPDKPYNLSAHSDENNLVISPDGSLVPRIVVSWMLPQGATSRFPSLRVHVRYRTYDAVETVSPWKSLPQVDAFQGSTAINVVEPGLLYEIQIRSRSQFDVYSAWTDPITHLATSRTTLPFAPESLTHVSLPGMIEFELVFGDEFDGLTNASRLEIAYDLDNSRDGEGVQRAYFTVPRDLAGKTLSFAVIFDDELTRYFWARIIDSEGNAGTYIPASATDGHAATPLEPIGSGQDGLPGTGIGGSGIKDWTELPVATGLNTTHVFSVYRNPSNSLAMRFGPRPGNNPTSVQLNYAFEVEVIGASVTSMAKGSSTPTLTALGRPIDFETDSNNCWGTNGARMDDVTQMAFDYVELRLNKLDHTVSFRVKIYEWNQPRGLISLGSSWSMGITQIATKGATFTQFYFSMVDGQTVIWLGQLSSPPANPSINWAYYDTTLKRARIWDGDNWEDMVYDGYVTNYIFRRATAQPATPTGNGIPSGWSDNPPAPNGLPLWSSKAAQTTQSPAVTIGAWSTPFLHDGARWLSGIGEPSGVLGVLGDFYLDEATGNTYEKTGTSTWTLRANIAGEDGTDGTDGQPGHSLAYNYSFEDADIGNGTLGWTFDIGWARANAGSSAKSGSFVGRYIADGSGALRNIVNANRWEAKAGEKFYFEWSWRRQTTITGGALYLRFLPVGYAATSTVIARTAAQLNAQPVGTWVTERAFFTVPDQPGIIRGAVFIRASGITAGQLWIDNIIVKRATDTDDIVDGAVSEINSANSTAINTLVTHDSIGGVIAVSATGRITNTNTANDFTPYTITISYRPAGSTGGFTVVKTFTEDDPGMVGIHENDAVDSNLLRYDVTVNAVPGPGSWQFMVQKSGGPTSGSFTYHQMAITTREFKK